MRLGRLGGHTFLGRRACFSLTVLLALGLLAPSAVLASTFSEPPLPACNLDRSSAVAGQPFELAGVTSDPDELVGILARKDTGESREGSVAVVAGRWQGVIVFGAADAGSWTIDVTVDGQDCVSPLTVTLPAGVVAPPTRTPDPVADEEPLPSGIDGGTIRGVAALGAAIAVVASWLLLASVALARLAGQRPLRRRPLRRIVQAATFVAVLGAFVFAELFVYFGVSMSHFDTGMSTGEAAILDIGLLVALVAGSVIGTIAARRVPGPRAP